MEQKRLDLRSLSPSLRAGVFLTETQRYIDRGRHLEKPMKRLREERGESGVFSPALPLHYFKPINLSLKLSFWLVPTL